MITIGARKKTKHVQIAQPVTIGPSSGMFFFLFNYYIMLHGCF